MRTRSLLAAGLAGLIVASAPVRAQLNEANSSLFIGSMVLAAPFSLAYASGEAVSEASRSSLNLSQRWKVDKVQPRGARTELQLHCDDKQLKLDLAIDNRIAQAQQIKVGDELDIEAIGSTGYAVKKGQATVVLLEQPGAGMAHSTPRS
jgi:hypothetical protein